ncbi:MAG: metal-dependent transcriptional regulator [Anaerolineales bacterium]
MTKSLSFTASIQDYLKHIYQLAAQGETVTTTALAQRLGVRPASVTGMLRRLAQTQPPLIVYHKHRGVSLTPEGQRAALEVIRHHRLIETWLVQSLGYSWDEVHEEACRLEHVISEQLEARLASLLGHPAYDPHGEPIPDQDLNLPPDTTLPLASLRPPQRGKVCRVQSEQAELLRYLEEKGLRPGAVFRIVDYSPFDGNLSIVLETSEAAPFVIGLAVSMKVFVEVIS